MICFVVVFFLLFFVFFLSWCLIWCRCSAIARQSLPKLWRGRFKLVMEFEMQHSSVVESDAMREVGNSWVEVAGLYLIKKWMSLCRGDLVVSKWCRCHMRSQISSAFVLFVFVCWSAFLINRQWVSSARRIAPKPTSPAEKPKDGQDYSSFQYQATSIGEQGHACQLRCESPESSSAKVAVIWNHREDSW